MQVPSDFFHFFNIGIGHIAVFQYLLKIKWKGTIRMPLQRKIPVPYPLLSVESLTEMSLLFIVNPPSVICFGGETSGVTGLNKNVR